MADKKLNIKIETKGAQKSEKALGGVNKQIKSLAKQAVLAAGGFMALRKAFSFTVELKNFARDAEETTNKFKTVFSSMAKVATQTAKTLADSFGMAHTTAMELLGDTGDILVGFGFTEKAALDLSDKVNRLAVDLASFTNFEGGAARASEALTKAILGETESAKALGIVLRQGTSEFKDSVKVLQESEGMTFNQAMATTLLNDAYRQSTKAVGDFARTQDDLANQERILAERFKEIKEEIGASLVPAFQSLTSIAMDAAEAFSDWIAIPTSEKLDDDRFASERLFNVLEDVNASQQVRSGAIKEINSKYGSYLTNLLTEKSSLKDIQKAQDDINRKMLERIAIEVQREDIADNMREMKALWKEEKIAINAVADAEVHLSAKQKEATKAQKVTREQMEMQGEISQTVASANLDMVESYVSFAGGAAAAGSGVHSANQALINAQEVLDANREKQKELTDQTALLREEQEKLAEAFGIKTDTDKEGGAGKPEIEELIISEEQKASIRAEFNQRFLEMTVGQNELQNIELQNATERFREAGVEEVEIAKFVAERKKAIDLEYKNSKISSVGSLVGAFSQLNQASKGSALVSKRLAQGEAAMSTWVAVNKALAAGVPPWNIVQATAIGAMGLANVIKIEQQEFAQGGIVPGQGTGDTVPAMLTPGEVILNQAQQENLAGGMGITINISAPLVDETVVDTIIPAIQKAQRLNLA